MDSGQIKIIIKHIQGNGFKEKSVAMANILRKTILSIKATFVILSKRVLEMRSLSMAINIKDNTKMGNRMGKENIHGHLV
jgi:hypothetical protein